MAAFALVAAILLSSLVTVDRFARDELEKQFQRALTTFALARTLNGVISAVQGTELALQPAGVGVTLTPGEILDPVNDLVERFSWIMLLATVSLGMQQILLTFGEWWAVRLVVAGLGLIWLIAWLWKWPADGEHGTPVKTWVLKCLLIGLILRFAVPAVVLLSLAVYETVLDAPFSESIQAIEAESATLETVADEGSGGDTSESSGLASSLGRAWDSARESIAVDDRIRELRARSSELVTHVIRLSAVFVLQTVVLPLVFIWLLLGVLRRLLR